MSTQVLKHMRNEITLWRKERGYVDPDWGFNLVNDSVWTQRNTLGLVESQDDYPSQLKAIVDVYNKVGGYNATTSTWQTAVSNAVTAKELQAANIFVNEIGAGILAKIVRFNPFIGTNSTARTTPLIGAGTDTLVAAPAWAYASGYTLNGTSQYINTGIPTTSIGTAIGGMGVYYNALTSAANSTLIGSLDAVNGAFNLTYTTTPATKGLWGGTANFTTDASTVANMVKKHLHVSRTGATSLVYYIDGVAANTQATSTTVTSSNDNCYVGARNNDGTADQFTTGAISSYVLSNGTLTAGEQLTLAAAVKAFMGKLGR